MRKIIIPILFVLFSHSCKLTEKPEFVRIAKVDVVRADLNTVTLKADAVFLNHNHLAGVLRTDNIDVFVDQHLVAQVSTEEFNVPRQDEFTVPLDVNFDTSKLVDSTSNDLLGSLLNQFLNKKVTVRFEGELAYKVAGYSSTYPIKHIEEIVIR